MNNPNWADKLGTRKKLSTAAGEVAYYSLPELAKKYPNINRLPYSIRILLEAALRQEDGFIIDENHIKTIAEYNPKSVKEEEIPFKPARVVMQDFTGVPGVVDLAAMRDAMTELKIDPTKINPVLPVDLVIDHSVQVDFAGAADSLDKNNKLEFERNGERYEFLRWGSGAFSNFQVVPPATGIVHQVNLEYLAKVVQTRTHNGELVAYPDSLVGTDSHTTMINGLGVLGWGVGGIEAEAVMLEQPIYMLIPEVVGFKLTGKLPEGTTATDLVLTVTQMLRKHGVVGKFVEFYGEGLSQMSLADRATIANMAPEYGATMGFFPIDDETIRYMKLTGRDDKLVDLVEKYSKAQGLFLTKDAATPDFSSTLELDMGKVVPSIAGPKRPQDRIELKNAKAEYHKAMAEVFKDAPDKAVDVSLNGKSEKLGNGSLVIAAITSCTNTSNPSVLVAAGLVAEKAAKAGLKVPATLKSSLAPGSRVVTKYLEAAGLQKSLDAIGFNTVGYGCTTCIGNSGPIDAALSEAINKNNLTVGAVLSGNRNFEGRIHADVKANYLASPPLVVAYALAGTMDIDFEKDKIQGKVTLKEIWPTQKEVNDALAKAVTSDLFKKEYGNVFKANEMWNNIKVGAGNTYQWDQKSTYIAKPNYFENFSLKEPGIPVLKDIRCLAIFGDSVTTDHISPAGNIKKDGPAGKYLQARGVAPADFNTYGARRGNHEVMVRGTFANTRIKNLMTATDAVSGKVADWTKVPEGGNTVHIPSGEKMSIFDAAMKYMEAKTPLIVLAGKEYGTGSSRDWAAKGPALQGIKVVIAESFERIHRSNLIGMGILPLQFKDGQNAQSLGLDGSEVFNVEGYDNNLKPRTDIKVTAKKADGSVVSFTTMNRVDTPVEVVYLKNGGILHTVLRKLGAG
ncbi:MAG: aconitate hydratase AcnA [Spirochaetes bacterium]|nr:aconitate hydratase AcnA [Spirochaetota bacterium]